MALSLVGQLRAASQQESSWNGSSWSAPYISYSSLKTLGQQQGIEPVASGSWDRKEFRLNPVVIEKTTGAYHPISISMMAPNGIKWGIRYEGEPLAFRIKPDSLIPSATTWSTNSANYVANAALAKAHESAFDGLTQLGELKETLEGIRHPLQAVRDFLTKSLRRPKESPREFLKRVSDASSGTWLEYRYGILPLILTIKDALDLYREGLPMLSLDKMYRKSSRVKYERGTNRTTSIVFSSFVGKAIISQTTSGSYTGKIYFKYDKIPSWYESMGLDFFKLPEVAWELTRLSFVWDWFLGIGDWLGALQAERDRTIFGIGVSHKVTTQYDVAFVPGSLYVSGQPSWKPADTYSDSIFSYKLERLERRVISHTGVLLPAWSPKALGIDRTLDALSLIWQSLPRRK